MSSAALSTPTNESTPLLADAAYDATNSAQTAPSDPQPDHESDEFPNEASGRGRLPRIVFIALAMITIDFLFVGALTIMNQYSLLTFGRGDYWFGRSSARYLGIDVALIIVTLANIFMLKRNGYPLWSLLNLLILGYCALALYSLIIVEANFKSYRPIECPDYLDDPRSVYYPGSLAECLDFNMVYVVICWIRLFVAFMVANLLAALFIGILVQLVQNINDPNNSSFRLSAGQFSIEVAVRWGQPSPRNENSEA